MEDRATNAEALRVPRRVLVGSLVVAGAVFVLQLPGLLGGLTESPYAGRFHMLIMISLPLAAGFGGFAFGVAQILLGCIDYARRPRH